MAELHYEEPKSSKVPIIALGAKVLILASVIVSIVILKNTNISFKAGDDTFRFRYQDTDTYPYVLYSMVVGFGYTCVQLPLAIYYVIFGKRLINRYGFLQYEFYGDKVCLMVLSTAVGALFGATMEIKRMVDNLKTINDGDDAKDYRSKMGDFCKKAYVSAVLLLLAFLCSAVSSVISSRALSKRL